MIHAQSMSTYQNSQTSLDSQAVAPMTDNPFKSGAILDDPRDPRATRWMLWFGGIAILLAILCLLATVAGIIWSYNSIAASSVAPKPSDVANGSSSVLILPVIAVPLFVVGLVFLILGFVRRQSR